jgi:hypothetical protein
MDNGDISVKMSQASGMKTKCNLLLKNYNSPPIIAEVKKMWIYTSTPPYTFMV